MYFYLFLLITAAALGFVAGIKSESNELENSSVVGIRYRGKTVCTGIMLDVDFVLTSVRCVNVTQKNQLTVLRSANFSRKIDRVSTNFGFAILHINPKLKLEKTTLTAVESPERGEECQVLTYNNDVSLLTVQKRFLDLQNLHS